jgi:hypothetical protein
MPETQERVLPTHHIKARKVGGKRYYFVSPRDGGLNPLRIHASQYTESKAEEVAAILRADNPEFEFKVVRI